MFSARFPLVLASLAFSVFSGCGNHPGVPSREAGPKAPVTGDLVPLIAKFADAHPVSACDRKFLPP